MAGSVAPAQHSASFAWIDGRARIQPEAKRTLACAHSLGELHGRNLASALMQSRFRNRTRDRGGKPIQISVARARRKGPGEVDCPGPRARPHSNLGGSERGAAKHGPTADWRPGGRPQERTSLPLRLAPPAGNPLANTVSESEPNDQNDCDLRHWGPPERDRPAIDAGYSSFGSELKTQWPFGGLHLSQTVLRRTTASHHRR